MWLGISNMDLKKERNAYEKVYFYEKSTRIYLNWGYYDDNGFVRKQ